MSELDDAIAEMARNTAALETLALARRSPFPRDQVIYQTNPGSKHVCLVPAEGVGTPPRPSGKVIAFPRRFRLIEGGA